MDSISDSDSEDVGSIPTGTTTEESKEIKPEKSVNEHKLKLSSKKGKTYANNSSKLSFSPFPVKHNHPMAMLRFSCNR